MNDLHCPKCKCLLVKYNKFEYNKIEIGGVHHRYCPECKKDISIIFLKNIKKG
jgi:hypothetical protein